MKVTLEEEDAKSLTLPELAPHGVEREADYRVVRPGELFISAVDPTVIKQWPKSLARSGGCLHVVTPRKPSLAQLVKDSGWRCPLATGKRVLVGPVDTHVVYGRYEYHALLQKEFGPILPVRPKHVVSISLDDDGYPIVEEGDA